MEAWAERLSSRRLRSGLGVGEAPLAGMIQTMLAEGEGHDGRQSTTIQELS